MVSKVRSREEVERVLRLAGDGTSQAEIARQTGIPRLTISGWVRGKVPRPRDVPALDGDAYSYLLGMYLGDGYIARFPRASCLRITLGRELSRDHRRVCPRLPGRAPGQRRLRDPLSPPQLREGPGVLTAMAGPAASTRRGPEACEVDRAGGLAARDHARASGDADPRADPLRRLPLPQPRPPRREGLRVSALHVLEPVAADPRHLHGAPGPARDPVALVERPHDLDRPP
jgi:transcriptional regulator with XRE-family HTH domain